MPCKAAGYSAQPAWPVIRNPRQAGDGTLDPGGEDPGDDLMIDRAGDSQFVVLRDKAEVLGVGDVIVVGSVRGRQRSCKGRLDDPTHAWLGQSRGEGVQVGRAR